MSRTKFFIVFTVAVLFLSCSRPGNDLREIEQPPGNLS